MSDESGSHTVYHHRYHIVWIAKYRYKVLGGQLRDFCTTSGNITDDVILNYLSSHEPTGVSR